MKKASLLLAITLIVITIGHNQAAQAQSFRIVTVNTFTGALTGTALGGATIALQDKSDIDYYPLRFGLGMGTIMGLGTGFYDLSNMTGDSGFYVDGLISSASSTGTIILLDTFYGAATGAIVGVAVTLMADSPIVKGVQFGSAGGAWVGFAFGLVDAFALSSSGDYDGFYDSFSSNRNPGTSGLVEIRSNNDQYAIGFLNPMMFNSYQGTENGDLTTRSNFALELTRINITF